MISRVADLLQGQPGRWHDSDRGIAHRPLGDSDQPFVITLPRGDGDQSSDKRADHRVTERIRAYVALDDTCHRPGGDAPTCQLEQGPDRAGPFPLPTEGSEV